MLINKSFQDQTTPLLTLSLLLPVVLPNHDLYLCHHVYLEPLLFASEHHQLSLKHDNINGDRNSSKKNSRKNHLKELAKTPSSLSGLALKIEPMIQLPSRGVMLQFFLSPIPDTRLTNLCTPFPLIHVSYYTVFTLPSIHLWYLSHPYAAFPLDTCFIPWYLFCLQMQPRSLSI